ncbi:MAG: threonine synthase [Clostridia bacterium]
MYKGVIDKYKEYLPVSEKTEIITINEGNTPLIFAKNLSKELGINLFFKYEGLNPTASFKDRGMTLAVTKAVEEGANAIICASTGNTSASAAAYAARAAIKCFVLLPEGKVAQGKLAQAIAYGAEVVSIDDNFDRALELVQSCAEEFNMTIVNSINPYRIECQKTAAFEVCDDLGTSPDYLFIPVGNAGNITAYWKGFREYYANNKIDKLPKMMGWQAEGASPIIRGEIVKNPETIATAIRIGNPVSWQKAIEARDESKGMIGSVTDEEIKKAYIKLATKEGIFAEAGSCAGFAGVLKAVENNLVEEGSIVVSVLTGHGLKDPQMAISLDVPVHKVIADENDVYDLIEKLIKK